MLLHYEITIFYSVTSEVLGKGVCDWSKAIMQRYNGYDSNVQLLNHQSQLLFHHTILQT